MKDLQRYILESSKDVETKSKGAFKDKFKYSQSDWQKWLDNIYSGKFTKHVMIGNDPDNSAILIYFVDGEKMTHVATYIPKTQVLYCDDMHLFGNEVKESAEDGKNGHWEDFVDEDTGEIVTMWVNDPTPEEIDAKEKERKEGARAYYEKQKKENEMRKQLKLDELDDMVWDYEQQLKGLNKDYRDLRIDMEEELGQLYSSGKETEAENLAQQYGARENKLVKQQESLRKKLAAAKKKRDNASSKFWNFYNKLWDNE